MVSVRIKCAGKNTSTDKTAKFDLRGSISRSGCNGWGTGLSSVVTRAGENADWMLQSGLLQLRIRKQGGDFTEDRMGKLVCFPKFETAGSFVRVCNHQVSALGSGFVSCFTFAISKQNTELLRFRASAFQRRGFFKVALTWIYYMSNHLKLLDCTLTHTFMH